ncbi:thiamine-phosphate kinase [Evansella tamaricis]|uniref:Thiamine-monophosphate kinase n=1 Tax=Evansella tamaricis TaxID=2069301 RepID=A0ABS6JIP7_9BACI|nr:thiamine-phosphate kinase [Evansella tamaricis]MBU9713545.1 thiamine-phosphate kinase [Evansella tamaricis]
MNNEMKWIQSITPQKYHQPSLKVGIGDDAAIYHTEEGMETVVAVDTMVEGIHFTKKTMSMKAIGHKALAVNISDLAAMGAIPRYYLVSIAIPKEGWGKKELADIYSGMSEIGDLHRMDLIGGDTVSIKSTLVITVTAIGIVEKGRRLVRANAKPGDVVFVTGPLGLSAFGLEHLLNEGLCTMEDEKLWPYIKAHQFPVPQVKAGRLLAESNFRISLNDISDGLASETMEIAEASGVSIELQWNAIPTGTTLKEKSRDEQEKWILYGGEDFQLIGTVGKENWDELWKKFQENQLPLYAIGQINDSKGIVKVELINNAGNRDTLTKTGYDHL